MNNQLRISIRGNCFNIFETPNLIDLNGFTVTDNPFTDNPFTDNPFTDNPFTDNNVLIICCNATRCNKMQQDATRCNTLIVTM